MDTQSKPVEASKLREAMAKKNLAVHNTLLMFFHLIVPTEHVESIIRYVERLMKFRNKYDGKLEKVRDQLGDPVTHYESLLKLKEELGGIIPLPNLTRDYLFALPALLEINIWIANKVFSADEAIGYTLAVLDSFYQDVDTDSASNKILAVVEKRQKACPVPSEYEEIWTRVLIRDEMMFNVTDAADPLNVKVREKVMEQLEEEERVEASRQATRLRSEPETVRADSVEVLIDGDAEIPIAREYLGDLRGFLAALVARQAKDKQTEGDSAE